MPRYTLDVKAFLTVHVDAADEATARRMANDCVEACEGVELGAARINSASADGEADVVTEIDGGAA